MMPNSRVSSGNGGKSADDKNLTDANNALS